MKTLQLLIVCCFVTLFSFANVSNSEKEALISLYNATQGDQWNNSWDLNSAIDTWYGITIVDEKVVEINLSFNNLQGTLPNDIGNLVYLQKMNLGFNKLSGTLPASIGNLKALASLELFMNKFEGDIPKEVGNLNQLEILKLYSNGFT